MSTAVVQTLDLDDIAPADRLVTVTHQGQRLQLPVRGTLSIVEMVELLKLETRFNEAQAAGTGAIEVLAEMQSVVMGILRELTPDCPDLHLSGPQILELLAFVAGGDSVTQVVADTITPPASPDAEEAGVVETGPLSRSESPSAPSSSSSDAPAAGSQSGGPAAPGVLSDSTFETLTPV